MTKTERGTFEMNIQRFVEDKVDDIRRAVDKAEVSMNARLEILNEFRQTVNDSQERFMTKAEYYSAHQRICDDLVELQKSANIGKGKASMAGLIFSIVIAVISLLISVVKIWK